MKRGYVLHMNAFNKRKPRCQLRSNLYLLTIQKRSDQFTLNKLIFTFLFFISFTGITYATTYYVDFRNGNDSYNGTATSPQGGNSGPWKSLNKVNNTNFAPGDSILFRRGMEWSGTLIPRNGGVAGKVYTINESVVGRNFTVRVPDSINPTYILFGAYGTGSKPIINCQNRRGLLLYHNYLIVENLHLRNGGNNMIDFLRSGGNYWTIIRHIDLTNCTGNVVRFSEGGGNCWLDGLYLKDFILNGIYLEGSSRNPLREVLVENCNVVNTLQNGLEDAISCHKGKRGENIEGRIIIRNNYISGSMEDGLDITSGKYILLENNYIENCFEGGINVGNGNYTEYVELRGNFLKSNAIQKGLGGLNVRINNARMVNNIITGTGHHSVLLSGNNLDFWNNVIAPDNRTGNLIWFYQGVNNVSLKNNIFDLTRSEQQIRGNIPNSVSLDHNCYYVSNSSRAVCNGKSFTQVKSGGFENNGMMDNPEFVNNSRTEPDHFNIKSSSVCIDKGTNVDIETDYEKKQRPQGGNLDIGAYEYTSNGNGINTPPSFDIIRKMILDEDFGEIITIEPTPDPIPVEEANQQVTYKLTPENTSIANIDIDRTNGRITLRSIEDANGTQTFVITADDGQSNNNIFQREIIITVNPINDPPSFRLSGNVNVKQDFESIETVTVIPDPVPDNEVNQNVIYTISPDNVNFADVRINEDNGTVSIGSVAGMFGVQEFTVTANDGQSTSNTYSQTFFLEIEPLPVVPAFTLPDVIMFEPGDIIPRIITPVTNFPDSIKEDVKFTVNPTQVDFAEVSIDELTGTITIQPQPNTTGNQAFTVTATNLSNQEQYTQNFTLEVLYQNTPPIFSLNGDIIGREDFRGTKTLSVNPAPVPLLEQDQIVTYSISPTSVSFANISFNSNTGEVSVSTIENAHGRETFTITANDGQNENNTHSETFDLIISSLNDPPVFTIEREVIVEEDFTGTRLVSPVLQNIPENERNQNIVFSLSPSNVPFVNVSFDSTIGKVSFSAITNAVGSQVFTLTANDGQAQNSTYRESFTFSVTPVSEIPVFRISNDIQEDEDFIGVRTVKVLPNPLPQDEQDRTITYNLTPQTVSFADVTINPSDGTVSVSSLLDESGNQIFTITATDEQDQKFTYSQTFELAIQPVNDPPSFQLSEATIQENEDFRGFRNVNIIPDRRPSDEKNQTITYQIIPSNVSFARVDLDSETGEVTISSIPNEFGIQRFVIEANDGASKLNTFKQTFNLIVNPINDLPIFSISGDIIESENFTGTRNVSITDKLIPNNERNQPITYRLSPQEITFASIAFDSITGQVDIQSIQDSTGSQEFTIIANDGELINNIYERSFLLQIKPEEDPFIIELSKDTARLSPSVILLDSISIHFPDSIQNDVHQFYDFQLTQVVNPDIDVRIDTQKLMIYFELPGIFFGEEEVELNIYPKGNTAQPIFNQKIVINVFPSLSEPVLHSDGSEFEDSTIIDSPQSEELISNYTFVQSDSQYAHGATISYTYIYPNPAKLYATLLFESEWEGIFEIAVYDAVGRLIQTIQANKRSASHIQKLDISNYSKGLYYFTIKNEAEVFTHKLWKR